MSSRAARARIAGTPGEAPISGARMPHSLRCGFRPDAGERVARDRIGGALPALRPLAAVVCAAAGTVANNTARNANALILRC